jgi:hypothetical protein
MKQLVKSICLISMVAGSLTACKTTPVKPATPMPADIATTTYLVPASKNLIGDGFIQNIDFEGFSHGSKNAKESLRFNKSTASSFIVHRRIDNGMAGSGIKYLVNYDVKQKENSYSLTLKPTQSTAYQEGLIGKFDVPSFTPDELQNTIRNGLVYYKFEVDSKYNEESIRANFKRLSTESSRHYYFMNRDKKVRFTFNTSPYRNGSKVIIKAAIPAAETTENTFDFGVLENEVKAKMIEIVKA